MDIFNSIWRRRGRPSNEPKPVEERKFQITQTDRDYAKLLVSGDVAIKFWLPEVMATIMDEMCKILDTSRSDLVRQTLFTYLYGRYDCLGLLERGISHYQLRQSPMIFYQKSVGEITQDMGKNVEDLKVWIPTQMKTDIHALAERAGISLSEMLREIVISSLIGHTYLPSRAELLLLQVEIE